MSFHKIFVQFYWWNSQRLKKNEEGIFIAEAHSLSQHKHVAALSFLQGKKFNFEISFGEMVSGKQRLETAVSFLMVLDTNI